MSWALQYLTKKRKWDLDVTVSLSKNIKYKTRLILSWNAKDKAWVRLVTNVSSALMTLSHVSLAYQLRWQIELLFKEFKSHSSLRKFQTNNKNIAAGLIWAALIASFMKRFLSHTCQYFLPGEVVSTQKMAKIGHRFLRRLIEAAANGIAAVLDQVSKMVIYVRENCLRSRIKRDEERGRSRLSVNPVTCEA